MAISLVRKRAVAANRIPKETGLIHLLLRRTLPIPPAILLLMLLLVWCSSTLLSVSFFHVCISSRKLNLYCVSAGTRPHFEDFTSRSYYNTTSTTNINITTTTPTTNNNYNISSDKDILKAEVAYAVKIVEEQMQALRSHSTTPERRRKLLNQTTCKGREIFVYELPPKFNKELIDRCNGLLPWMNLCDYFANDALGEPISKLGKGWYRTHQYSLEPIFHSRVLRHPCRVLNADQAKLFYVPFFGGLDVLRWHFKNVSDQVKDSLGVDMVKWLEGQPSWARNSGKDHVFVLGKISWDFRRKNKDSWGTGFLELDQMQNPTKLLIERQPWHVNDVGIPHPTHFHPHSDDDIAAWQSKIMQFERKNLVSFAGAARPEAPENIRSVLIKQCMSGDGHCRFLDCRVGACSKPETVIELFMESEFCLQPPGDSPTRKSLFDSVVSGCIPVLFDPFTAYYQYPWHLPEDHGRYSVFIEKEEVRGMKVDVVEKLKKVSLKEREEMRRYIVYELMPGLVYGDSTSELQEFEDAFSISINNLIDSASKLGL